MVFGKSTVCPVFFSLPPEISMSDLEKYSLICAAQCANKTTEKKTNTQKTPSDGNCSTMLICLFVYLCIHQQNYSLFPSFQRILIEQHRRPSRRGFDFWNVSILARSKMVPVLATEGELRQSEACARCRWCVETIGAGAGAFNDGKWSNDGAIGRGSNFLSNRSAILVLKIRRNWYKSLRMTEEAD